MTKIIAPAIPQVGQEFNVRIDTPTRIGNAVGIFVGGLRCALGRVKVKYDDNPKYTFDLHGHEGKEHSAHNVYGVQVEHVFGDD